MVIISGISLDCHINMPLLVGVPRCARRAPIMFSLITLYLLLPPRLPLVDPVQRQEFYSKFNYFVISLFRLESPRRKTSVLINPNRLDDVREILGSPVITHISQLRLLKSYHVERKRRLRGFDILSVK